MGRGESWWQEIVALAKLSFGKNSKRIKSDYCLSHEIGWAQQKGANLIIWEICLKSHRKLVLAFLGSRTSLIPQQSRDQPQEIENTGRHFARKEKRVELCMASVVLSSNWKVDKLNSGDERAGRMDGLWERWRKYMMLPGRQAAW